MSTMSFIFISLPPASMRDTGIAFGMVCVGLLSWRGSVLLQRLHPLAEVAYHPDTLRCRQSLRLERVAVADRQAARIRLFLPRNGATTREDGAPTQKPGVLRMRSTLPRGIQGIYPWPHFVECDSGQLRGLHDPAADVGPAEHCQAVAA